MTDLACAALCEGRASMGVLVQSDAEGGLVTTGTRSAGPDLSAHWMRQVRPAGRSRRRAPDVVRGLRFAFYGRVSTAESQEPDSSRRWHREVAEDLPVMAGSLRSSSMLI